MDLATIEPRPAFLNAVSPPEYSIIVPHLYYYSADLAVGHGIFDFRAGFDSSVCVRPVVGQLVQKGDDFTDSSLTQERIELLVNGKAMEWHAGTLIGGTPGVQSHDDMTYTKWIEGSDYCWKTPLGLGRHEVTFQFRQTSGDVQAYSWYFEIQE